MANLKISELTELAAIPAADDVLAIVDTDVLTTKKITPANLMGGYQPLDTALTNISGLTYVSPSFMKLTADDTYTVRTYAEVLSDLSGTAGAAFSFNSQNITNVGDITSTTTTADQLRINYSSALKSHFVWNNDDSCIDLIFD